MKRALGLLMTVTAIIALKPATAAPSLSTDHSADDTGSGHLVDRWMALCREPEFARMKQWLTTNLSEEITKQVPVDGLAQNEVEFCKSHGGFRVIRKTTAGQATSSLVAVGNTSGVWFDISLSENATGRIAGMHHMVTTPPESELPKLETDAMIAAEIRRTVATLSRTGLFSGIVTVARGTQTIVSATGGYSDRESKVPITGATQFTLGSLGKMFTAVAIAQLVDQGKVEFNDTVGKFFPGYPNQTARDNVTVGMLLSHTAGLGDFLGKRTPEMMKRGVRRASEFMPLYEKDELQFPPGKGWAYSNAGLALVGAIAEKASGEDYPDYIRKHIFAVAGMTGSDANNVPLGTKSLVTPYTKATAQGPSLNWHEAERDIGSPAGGAISTADDLVRFADALRNGKLISKVTFAEMANTRGTTPWGVQYGYAMEIEDTYGRTVVGHSGGFPGVSTRLYVLLDSNYTVVVLANQDPPAAEYVGRKAAAIVAERAKLDTVTVPVRILGNYPVLTASIGGHDVPLIFDLGEEAPLVLTQAALDQLKITPTGETHKISDVKGNNVESNVFKVPRLVIGEAVFTDIKGRVDAHDPSYQSTHVGQVGYIGPALLQRYEVVLDYRRGTLTLIPPGSTSADRRKGCSGTEVPFLPEWNGAPVTKAHTEFGDLTFVWDTGAPVSVIRKTRTGESHMDSENQTVIMQEFRLGGVDFGPLNLRLLDYTEPPSTDGFIGTNFFAQHVVCIDSPGKRLLIQ